jgi:hypothetical protein
MPEGMAGLGDNASALPGTAGPFGAAVASAPPLGFWPPTAHVRMMGAGSVKGAPTQPGGVHFTTQPQQFPPPPPPSMGLGASQVPSAPPAPPPPAAAPTAAPQHTLSRPDRSHLRHLRLPDFDGTQPVDGFFTMFELGCEEMDMDEGSMRATLMGRLKGAAQAWAQGLGGSQLRALSYEELKSSLYKQFKGERMGAVRKM